MTLRRILRGKLLAAIALARIIKTCKNWRAVWSAWRGKGTLTEIHLRSGYRIVSGPEDDILSLFNEIYIEQQYTAGFYRPRRGDVVLDVGANIGTFAICLQHLTGGEVRVHCFEPGVQTRGRLNQNVELNRLTEKIAVYPFGVTDTAKQLTLHGNRFAGSRSTFPAEGAEAGGDSERIECVGLADAVRLTGASSIDLLKVDVEGAELEVLSEQDPATWAIIKRVVVEFHGSIRTKARESVMDLLTGHGFRITKIIEATPGAIDGILQAVRVKAE